MNTEEKLNRIVEKCRELLAIADKRSEGQWIISCSKDSVLCKNEYGFIAKEDVCKSPRRNQFWPQNAAYIAACAGAAEAGWRATIVAIARTSKVIECFDAAVTEGLNDRIGEQERALGSLSDLLTRRILFAYDEAKQAQVEILAAWPDELLK